MPGHLAYVFWHWPRPELPVPSYESKLETFQHALSAAKPPGLVEALSFRVGPLPWTAQQGSVYEDWYVVEDFAALGALNEAAVAAEARAPHDSVAKEYMKGAGGILKSISGDLELGVSRFATWTEKPIGPSYESYYQKLAEAVGEMRTDLWRRQMVLGPSTQFCVHSEDALELPSFLHPISSRVKRVA